MKQLLVRLGSGTIMAAGFVVLASAGASASNGSDCNHVQQSGYNQSYHNYNNNNNNNGGYGVQTASYNNRGYNGQYGNGYGNSNGGNNGNNMGMWYNGQWYNYSQMGYRDNCNRWVPYSSNWSSSDWQQWQQQGCQ